MVASEAIPFAKTGGLGDVVGSLPAALKALGHQVAVLLPRYGGISLKTARRVFDSLPVWLGAARYDTSLYLIQAETPFYFLDCPPLYDRDGYYGSAGVDYLDNDVRFAVLCQAALGVARHVFRPDIFHCHDWQAGLVPVYLRSTFALDPTFLAARTLFTIHNLGYHGLFAASTVAEPRARPRRVHAGRPGVLRQAQLHQGRPGLQRRAQHREPHVCARDPDAGVRLRAGGSAARAQRFALRHSQRRGLQRVEPGDRPSHRGQLLRGRPLRQALVQAGAAARLRARRRRP